MPPALAALPTVDLPNVELVRAGTWNGHDYSVAELERAVENYHALKAVWSVPLTLGHDGESALGDGAPALGWVSAVRIDGDRILADYTKVPEKLAQLIQSGAYAKRSCTFLVDPEIDGQVRQGLVLQNVALLGAHQPAVDGLEDIFPLYNRRRLAAPARSRVTIEHIDRRRPVNLPLALARLTPDARTGYDAWKAKHPTIYQLISGPPMSDIQSAVEKALAQAYPPAEGTGDDDAPGADGPSCNVLDWFVSGQEMSCIVSDQDVDNLWEIPFTYDQGTDTASLSSPIPVKGTYTQNTSGTESGGGGTDDPPGDGGTPPEGGAPDEVSGASPGGEAVQMARVLGHYATVQTLSRKRELDPEVEALVGPAEAAFQRLAAAVADSAVEDLITKASADFDALLQGVNAIAAGKPGVAEFRSLVESAKKALLRIKVAKPADGANGAGGGDAPPPAKPAVPTKTQNARQEEPDVKLSELAVKLGLPPTATQAEIDRRLDGTIAAGTMTAQLARRFDKFEGDVAEEKFKSQLERACSEGRLKRWKKPGEDGELYTTILTLSRADMRTAETMLHQLHPFVDTRELGIAGNQGEPPTGIQLSPSMRVAGATVAGVERELRKLGRDPAKLDSRPLGDRWREARAKREAERAAAWGIPPRESLTA